MRFLVAVTVAVAVLSGCGVTNTSFPVQTKVPESSTGKAKPEVLIVHLNHTNIAAFDTPRNLGGSNSTIPSVNGWDYRVGVGDVLEVEVWDLPELSQIDLGKRNLSDTGIQVQADGTFFYPYVGQVPARGKTPDQIRDDLTKRLTAFVPDPQLTVRVVDYKSQAISVTGQVKAPKRHNLTNMPLTLLEAIDAAGGLTELSDPRKVTITRGGKPFNVDLQAFLDDGAQANNPILRNGDIVNVAKLKPEEAYILGHVNKVAAINLANENVTLTQAVTSVGGVREASADVRGIFVFRQGESSTFVYQLNASSPEAYLLGTRFVLLPNDVVYVTSAPLYRWNRMISDLLPTLSTVRTSTEIDWD